MKNKLILILVLVSFFGFGQKIKYIETKTKHFGSYISQVQFIDTITGMVIKTIDVEKDNPFYKILPKPDKITTGPSVTRFYIYNNKYLNDIIPKRVTEKFLKNDTINYKIKSIDVSKGYVGHKNKDYCLILYDIVLSTGEYPIFTKTIVQMYNNKGELIFTKQWNEAGFHYYYSNDNKYLCYIVSQMIKEESKSTYYIYDIKNKTELYKGKLSNVPNNTDVYCENNKVMFTSPDNGIIFDTKKMLIYKYKYENGKFINIGNVKKFNLK